MYQILREVNSSSRNATRTGCLSKSWRVSLSEKCSSLKSNYKTITIIQSAFCDHFYCYHLVNVMCLSHKHASNKTRKRGPLLDFLTTPKTLSKEFGQIPKTFYYCASMVIPYFLFQISESYV